ncbi:NAD(P)-binding protein [Trichoderma novae-zelandiae]
MASSNLLVLTGATGFLGFRVLTVALEAGYNVRLVVRSAAKANKVLNSPSIKALSPSAEKLSYVIVENMDVPGAFDEALKGAAYVIHCASPIPSFGAEAPPTPEQYAEFFVQAARRVTIGLLESSRKAGTIKRIVITSSVAANVPFHYYLGQGDDKIFDAESRIPVDKGPYGSELQAYSASKAAALNESEAWVAENKPGFDLISILPGWIFGADELATSPEDFESSSTNSFLLGFLRGSQSEVGAHSNSVLVDDVAKIHVLALDPTIPGNQAFLAVADDVDGKPWDDAIMIIRENFPEAVEKGLLKTTGKQPTITVRVDAKKTEETFGFKFAGFDQQVKSLVKQYLEVVKA